MAELNVVDTGAGGAVGQIVTPYMQTQVPGYSFGTGNGYMEFGSGTPGSLPFRVDQAGNVTSNGTIANLAPTGTAAVDTANLQGLINIVPSGATITLGAGTFVLNGLTLNNPIRLTGMGPSTVLTCTTNLFQFNAGVLTTSPFEFDHFSVVQNGGSAITSVFFNFDGQNSHFHDLTLTLVGDSDRAWRTNGQSVINCTFENIIINSQGTVRTTPVWLMNTAVSGGIADNLWRKVYFYNQGQDNTQFMVAISCTVAAGAHMNNRFRDCYFEHPYGGAIQSLSGTGIVVDGCSCWDIDFTLASIAMGNPLYYFGEFSGARASQGIQIRNCFKDLGGTTAAAPDVYCESTCNQVLIDGYDLHNASTFTNDAFFNFNGCTAVTILNPPNATTENSSSTYSVAGAPVGLAVVPVPSTAADGTVTVANTTALTPIVALTLPTGILPAGKTYRISLMGTIQTTTTSGSLTFAPSVAGTVLAQTVVMGSQAGASGPSTFWMDIYITVVTTGGTGTAVAAGHGEIEFSSRVNLGVASTTPTTINTNTATPVVEVTAQWATANAANALNVTIASITPVN